MEAVCTKHAQTRDATGQMHKIGVLARFMHSPDWLSVLHLCTPTSLNLPRLATSQGQPVACRRSGWSRPWSGEVGLGSAFFPHPPDAGQTRRMGEDTPGLQPS